MTPEEAVGERGVPAASVCDVTCICLLAGRLASTCGRWKENHGQEAGGGATHCTRKLVSWENPASPPEMTSGRPAHGDSSFKTSAGLQN